MLGKLIKANFRKDMSHMVSFLLIVILSSFLMQFGLMLVLGYNSQFERKCEELNSPDLMVMTATFDPEERQEILEYITRTAEHLPNFTDKQFYKGGSSHIFALFFLFGGIVFHRDSCHFEIEGANEQKATTKEQERPHKVQGRIVCQFERE